MKTLMCTGLFACCALLLPVAGAETPLGGRVVAVEALIPIIDRPATNYHVRQAATPPVIDGEAGEWGDVSAMVLNSGGVWRNAPWKGPADASASLRLLWDREALYFCLQVTDDVHIASNADKDFWMNDCIQFVFDAYMNGPGGYDSDEYSFTLCDTPQGPLMASYYSPFTPFATETRMQQQTVKMSVAPEGFRVYEWAMPWASLNPVSPWILGRCGFGWSLNDNDGAGFKGALFWSPGVIFGRDASQLGQLVFDGALGARPALLGLRPEWKPLKAAVQSRWLNVAGAAPWGAARLLVVTPASGVVDAAVEVYRPGTKKPIARGALRSEVAAGQVTAFTWDVGGLPSGQYELAYSAQTAPSVKADCGRRIPFCQINLERLSANVDRIRQQFGLDRPWDALADAPAIVRRHRGLVAEMMEWVEMGQPVSGVPDYIPFDHQPLQILEALQVLEAVDAGRDYLGAKRGQFWSAYYSSADGSGQHFVMTVPANYHLRKVYPLVVSLHGSSGRPTPKPRAAGQGDHLQVDPWGRGDNGFRALGENDVLSVIRYVQEWYNVDPCRIYITGGSMGGGGAWQIASRHPGLFAAAGPACGWAGDAPLENLLQVPVFNQHGLRDWVVPIDLSRYAVSRLQQWGYPVVHKEVPDAGHRGFASLDWLLKVRRPSRPRTITCTWRSLEPPMNTAYWLAAHQAVDCHEPMRVTAAVLDWGDPQTVTLGLVNVAVLELNTAAMPVDRQKELLLQVGFDFIEQQAPLPDRLFVLRTGEHWRVTDRWLPPAPAVRAYRVGAAANLYTGEPLMIVYGAGGTAERVENLRAAAESLARWAGAGGDMATGRFAVKADRDLTEEDLLHFNLVLLGGARDSSLAVQVMKTAGLRIESGPALVVGDREPVSLSGAGLRLFYYNPLAPRRWVFLIATEEDGEQARRWYGVCRRLLTGAGSGNEGDAADLVVQSLVPSTAAPVAQAGAGRGGPERRRMQFTEDWQWRKLPGAGCRAPEASAGALEMERARLRVIRRTAGADIALGWGAKQEDQEFDPRWFTLADLATKRSPGKTLLCRMTGEELADIRKQWLATGEMTSAPEYGPADMDSNRVYQVAMPPDLCWMLSGARQRNLSAPKAGPDWRAEDLWAEVFGDEALRTSGY